jgi:hypothetical protein
VDVAALLVVAATAEPSTVHAKLVTSESASASEADPAQLSVLFRVGADGVRLTDATGAEFAMVTEATPAVLEVNPSDAVTATVQTSPRVVALAGRFPVVDAAEATPSTDHA